MQYCVDWSKSALYLKSIVFAVPLAIVFVNFISKTILRTITSIEGRQSKPEEVYSSAVNMFILSFINVAIVI